MSGQCRSRPVCLWALRTAMLISVIFASVSGGSRPAKDERSQPVSQCCIRSGRLNTRSASPPPQRFDVTVDTSRALHLTGPRYLSVTIDSNYFKKKLPNFDFRSKKLQNMAAALSPTYIRFGGTMADFLHFEPDAKRDGNTRTKKTRRRKGSNVRRGPQNFTFPGFMWDDLTRFCDYVGWDIMWDFNLFFWTPDGLWDPSQAKRFLRYSADRGVRIPSFQLGNEPNAFKSNFNLSVEPDVLAKGFNILRDVLAEFPQYAAGGIYGPEVTNLDRRRGPRQYLTEFLKAGGCDAVTEIGVHHYYLNGRTATTKDFLKPSVMDALKNHLDNAYNITWGNCRVRKPIRLTETSSAFGGGAKDASDAYAAGFLWLDKLGLSAKYGITHVFRQTFWGGQYALVDKTITPNPDFWLSVLYKRLIEGPVFHASSEPTYPNLRLYAHCTRKQAKFYEYPAGAMVIYYLNMDKGDLRLTLSQYQDSKIDLFLLTAGDKRGLESKQVKLNGRLLQLNGSLVPSMLARTHDTGDVVVPRQSIGFIVIQSANVLLCKTYHRAAD